MVEDFIREAVHASRERDRQLEAVTEGSAKPPADDAPQLAETDAGGTGDKAKKTGKKVVKKRRGAVDANWKTLQKSLTAAKQDKPAIQKRPRGGRKRGTAMPGKAVRDGVGGGDGNSSGAKQSGPLPSMFMKRTPVHTERVTRVIALDCEMVGVGPDGKSDALARVSVVNFHGDVLYDTFVRPNEPVTDYRTRWSGVRAADVAADAPNATSAFEAQQRVGELLRGRVVVGHAIRNDMRVLRIAHPWADVRDTSDFYKRMWRRQGRRGGARPALRVLVAQVLGVDSFQKSEHDSCEDARAALALYKRHEAQWESDVRQQSAKRRAKMNKPARAGRGK